jgi:superfamily II DNA or RNA helicase
MKQNINNNSRQKNNIFPPYTSANFQNTIDNYLSKYKAEIKNEPTIKCDERSDEQSDSEHSDEGNGRIEEKCRNITLLPQQQLISDLINDRSPYRGLLLYHEVGSGKTYSAVNVAEQTRMNIIILAPSKIKKIWVQHIINFTCKKYLKGVSPFDPSNQNLNPDIKNVPPDIKSIVLGGNEPFVPDNKQEEAKLDRKEERKKMRKIMKLIGVKYSFISSNANNTKDLLLKENLNNKLIIIDECHRLFHTISLTEQGKEIYKQLLDAKGSKFLLLSGTPAISDPYELALIFTLLRGRISESEPSEQKAKIGTNENEEENKQKINPKKYLLFPSDYEKFVDYFVDRNAMRIKNKNIFQERIIGLVSYFKSTSINLGINLGTNKQRGEGPLIPKLVGPIVQHLKMSTYQWTKYSKNRAKEIAEERRIAHRKKEFTKKEFGLPGRTTSSTYKIKSRQSLNFVLPSRGKGGVELIEPSKKEVGMENIWTELFDKIEPKDLKKTEIEKYSPKIKYILDYLDKNKKGIILIYSNYLDFGTKIIASVLKSNGYVEYTGNVKYTGNNKLNEINGGQSKSKNIRVEPLSTGSHDKANTDKADKANPHKDGDFVTFSLLSGETDVNQIDNIIDVVNNKENKYGKNLRILLITSAFSEGKTINNVNTVFIFEPHWKYYRIPQVIGRAVRICTHNNLPPEERIVKVYILLVVSYDIDVRLALGEKTENPYDTTDTMIYQEAITKQKILDSFLQAIREVAIDCNTLLSHNSLDNKNFKCLSCHDSSSKEPNYYSNIEKHIAQRKINRNTYCIKKTVIDTLIGPIIIENVLFVYDPDTGNVYQITNIRYVGRYDTKFRKVLFVPPFLPEQSEAKQSYDSEKQNNGSKGQNSFKQNVDKKSSEQKKGQIPFKQNNKIKKIMGEKMGKKIPKDLLLKTYTDIYDDPRELKGVIRTSDFDKTGILYHQKTYNAYEILPGIIRAGYYDFDNKKVILFDDYHIRNDFKMYKKEF